MDTKHYLSQISVLDLKISNKIYEKTQLKNMLCSVPSCVKDVNVQTDFNSRLYMRGSHKNAQFFQQNRCNFLPNLVFFIVTSRKVVFFSIPVQYFL